MQQFGLRLRERRIELGLSRMELAEKSGINRSTIRRYETGEIQNVSVNSAAVMADALGTSPGWLLGEEKKKPRSAGTEPRHVLKGYLKHEDRITRTVEAVKDLCAQKKMTYAEMVDAVRLCCPKADKSTISKALNSARYGVTLSAQAAGLILSAYAAKEKVRRECSDGSAGSSGYTDA